MRGRRAQAFYLAVFALLALAYFARDYLPGDWFSPRPQPSGDWRVVERVVDGDTLVLDGGERVRLSGVDTPETVDPRRPVQHFGKEASAFTQRMAEGKRARLAFGAERRDRYGRTLAYVYLEDGTFLNAEIIRQGYGHAYTRFPFEHQEEFRRYEREARDNKRGLWAQ